jgi:hypothetical protein
MAARGLFLCAFAVWAAVPITMTAEEKLNFAKEITAAYCTGVELEYFEKYGGFGLVATQNLPFKNEYCEIPYSILLHSFADYPWSKYFAHTTPRSRIIAMITYDKFVNTEKSHR